MGDCLSTIDAVHRCAGCSRDDIQMLAEVHKVPFDTIVSIYSTKYQRVIKQTQRDHMKKAAK